MNEQWINIFRIIKRIYPDNHYIEEHTHPLYHFLYVIDGKGMIELGGETIETTSNTLSIIPSETKHAIYCIHQLRTIEIKAVLSEDLEK